MGLSTGLTGTLFDICDNCTVGLLKSMKNTQQYDKGGTLRLLAFANLGHTELVCLRNDKEI
jgi:hypothetical protein